MTKSDAIKNLTSHYESIDGDTIVSNILEEIYKLIEINSKKGRSYTTYFFAGKMSKNALIIFSLNLVIHLI